MRASHIFRRTSILTCSSHIIFELDYIPIWEELYHSIFWGLGESSVSSAYCNILPCTLSRWLWDIYQQPHYSWNQPMMQHINTRCHSFLRGTTTNTGQRIIKMQGVKKTVEKELRKSGDSSILSKKLSIDVTSWISFFLYVSLPEPRPKCLANLYSGENNLSFRFRNISCDKVA